jgi:hypothetical protein
LTEHRRRYARKYYHDNRERQLELQRLRRAANPEKAQRVDQEREHKRRLTPKGWARLFVYGARTRAKKRRLKLEITAADVLAVWPKDNRCPVFGSPFEFGRTGQRFRPLAPSLDQIIPGKGYIRGNIAVVSWRANILKRDATPTEIRKLAAWVKKVA